MTLEAQTSVWVILRLKINSVKSLHGKNNLLKHASHGLKFLRHNPGPGLEMGPFSKDEERIKSYISNPSPF